MTTSAGTGSGHDARIVTTEHPRPATPDADNQARPPDADAEAEQARLRAEQED